jgi:hypothetical protein
VIDRVINSAGEKIWLGMNRGFNGVGARVNQ